MHMVVILRALLLLWGGGAGHTLWHALYCELKEGRVIPGVFVFTCSAGFEAGSVFIS